MKLFNQDANTESASSTNSATQATVALQTDANSKEVSASSAEQKQDAKPESLTDVVKKFKADLAAKAIIFKGEQSISSVEGEAKSESSVLEKNTTQEEAPKAELTDDKLPFHNHPRWQQMVKEKTELGTKVQELEKYKDAGVRMQNVETFCQKNNIPAHEYDNILSTWALVKSNPQEGLKKLQQTVQALQIHLGEALPADLQQAVDDGNVDIEFAKQTAKLRLEAAQNKVATTRSQEQQQAHQAQEVRSAIEGWKTTMAKADASFKPKSNGQPDGKFEFVNDKFSSLWNRKPPQTLSEVVTLCQQAYDEVNSFITQVSPKQPAKRPPSSQRSVQPTNERIDTSKPGWAKKVAVQHLAAHAA